MIFSLPPFAEKHLAREAAAYERHSERRWRMRVARALRMRSRDGEEEEEEEDDDDDERCLSALVERAAQSEEVLDDFVALVLVAVPVPN